MGVPGDLEFRQILGEPVLDIEVSNGTYTLKQDIDGLPIFSKRGIVAMILPDAQLANMATRISEAAHDDGSIHLVLGTTRPPPVEVIVPQCAEVDGIPTPPTPP